MVLLLPLEGERIKGCSRCPTVGLVSAIPERSSFYARDRAKGLFDPQCRECAKAIATAYQRETGAPRIYQRKMRAALRRDPAAYEAYLAQQRVYGARYRARHGKEINERIRIDRRLKREREGEPMAVVASPRNVTANIEHPMPPFRAWLRRLIALERASGHEAPHKRVAARLKVSDRTLGHWLADPVDTVDEAIIDKAVTAHGGYMLWEILEADYDEPDGELEVPPRKRGVCAERGCEEPTDGRLCRVHAAERFGAGLSARLAVIRAEFQDESMAMAAMGGATRAESRRNAHRSKAPSCCNPHCWAPREIGERFCDECVDAGWVEEETFS